MLLIIRLNTGRMRALSSFTLSAALHGSVLAWVALAPLIPRARPSSIYEQEIQPNRTKIVWYSLSERLPTITPQKQEGRVARAQIQFHQAMVAGTRDDERPPQLIWTPAPEIKANQMLPAPNVVALAPAAKPLRDFQAPPVSVRIETPAPVLPDSVPLARAVRSFAPPVPMRKVDPKYIPAAADEGVEGHVRLAAVIRRNGHVEQIELVRHLHSRLDASSQEALAKWEFTPASLNGVPVDVDAIFEIPFHLAPKPSK